MSWVQIPLRRPILIPAPPLVFAPVAQWIEHRPSKPRVAGSIPAGRASDAAVKLMEDVAQLVRAPDCDSGGRGFEPRLPPQIQYSLAQRC